MGPLLSLIAVTSHAEQWYIEPWISLRSGYDDNVQLYVDNPKETFSLIGTVHADFGYRTKLTEVDFRARLSSRRYENVSDINADEGFFELDARSISERDIFGFQARQDYDTTRTSELETTGLIQSSVDRSRSYIQPYWQREVNERIMLMLSYGHTEVSYEAILVDYTNQAANLGLTYEYSPRTRLLGTFYGTAYEAKSISTRFDTLGTTFGARHQYNETINMSLSVGIAHTDSSYMVTPGQLESSTHSARLFDATLKKDWETVTLEVSAGISETPSGLGRLIRKNFLGMNWTKYFHQRLRLGISVQVYNNEKVGGLANAADERNYFSFKPRLVYELTEWALLSGEFRYRTQEYTASNSDPAESNAVFVSLRYNWPRQKNNRQE